MTDTVTPELTLPQRERIYRRNFPFFLADSILFNIAMGIIGTTTVIPDFVRQLTDSEILIGLSGSIFAIGFSLPQLFIARAIIRHARKKWWFVGPNIPVRFVILLFALITMLLGPDRPEIILVAFFVLYSIAALGDGLVGVPWADMAGTSLSGRWRARLFGITTATTGIVMLLIAPMIGVVLGETGPGFPYNYAALFGIAGVLFALSTLPGLFFHELPGGKAAPKTPTFAEFLPDLGRMLRDDVPFRAFVVTRVFTSLFMMAAPFYVGFATVTLGLSSQVAVPVLLAMQTLGSVTGAIVYTWLGARNNLMYIRMALGAAALLPVCALLAGVVGPTPLYFGFLISGMATSANLFPSYVNWVVTYATPDQRPVYVGLSNTVAAMVGLMAPFIAGTIAQTLGYEPLFVVALMMALSALFVTLRYMRNTPANGAPELAVDTGAVG